MDYNPLTDPLELPVQTITLRCQAAQPLYFRPRPGSTPGTTLFGAFGVALCASSCLRNRQQQPLCPVNPLQCALPEQCSMPWLFKPYSQVHRRTMARPLLMRAEALESLQTVSEFNLDLVLWGRHAIATRDEIMNALVIMGKRGLEDSNGKRIDFTLAANYEQPVQTLAERLEEIAAGAPETVRLYFETPFMHREKVQLEDGSEEKLFLAGGDLPLTKILGNVAYELVAWDIEDRAVGNDLDREQRHDLARRARRAAEAAVETIIVTAAELQPSHVGERYSRGNKMPISLGGFIGWAELQGDLHAALPWLLALSLAGGGQKRTMGFGVVGLWFHRNHERQKNK